MPPWSAGAATGIGSLPGADPREAARLVAGELPAFAHVPELPGRGPAAGLIGRALGAIAADTFVDLQPSGWRLVARPGLDQRRAQAHLSHDLDAVEEMLAGYAGPLKLQVAGPWTAAAGVELPRGDRALADRGAARDLAEALAEGLRAHVADVRRRVPGATVVVQLDEPSLPAVRAGAIPTASGFGRINPVGVEELLGPLRVVLDGAGDALAGLHCCAADPPLDLALRLGVAFVSVDVAMLGRGAEETLAELLEAGVTPFLGLVPALDPGTRRTVAEDGAPARAWWRRTVGQPAERLAASVVVTPACGLAGASPAYARAALTRANEVARSLLEAPDAAEER